MKIGYKKVAVCNEFGRIGYAVLKLQIIGDSIKPKLNPEHKMRCQKAKVIKIEGFYNRHTYRNSPSGCVPVFTKMDKPKGQYWLRSMYDFSFTYVVGKTAIPSGFNSDIHQECGSGINYFGSKRRARRYNM